MSVKLRTRHYNSLEPIEVGVDELAPVGTVRVCDEPEVRVERLGRLVVERIEEVDAVLVGLVREVGEKALVNKVLHLLASDLARIKKVKQLFK